MYSDAYKQAQAFGYGLELIVSIVAPLSVPTKTFIPKASKRNHQSDDPAYAALQAVESDQTELELVGSTLDEASPAERAQRAAAPRL